MAKIKGKLIKENKIGSLMYIQRKSHEDGWTHNVRSVGIKPKRRKK
jgi:hypothetical protein